MRRTIEITYVMTVYEQVEVPDCTLTQAEIDLLCDRTAQKGIPPDAESVDWNWITPPLAKDLMPVPPEEYWFETSLGPAAASSWIAIFRDFPTPKGFCCEVAWHKPIELVMESLNDLIEVDFETLPLHFGWFRKSFLPIKDIPEIVVRGNLGGAGYVFLSDSLVCILMPLKANNQSGCFQFNRRILAGE
jgi:hypothetical protein